MRMHCDFRNIEEKCCFSWETAIPQFLKYGAWFDLVYPNAISGLCDITDVKFQWTAEEQLVPAVYRNLLSEPPSYL